MNNLSDGLICEGVCHSQTQFIVIQVQPDPSEVNRHIERLADSKLL